MCDTAFKKILGFCSFVGLRYSGYQEQAGFTGNPNTIQQTMEVFLSYKNIFFILQNRFFFKKKSALFKITKTRTKISSCSRTDAGVNAFCLPFHFTISNEIDVYSQIK